MNVFEKTWRRSSASREFLFRWRMLAVRSRTTVIFVLITCVENWIYLYDTRDASQVEYFDCLFFASVKYCRRPRRPIDLTRDHDTSSCEENDGILHRFNELRLQQINISTIVQEWRSGIDRVEEYSRFLRDPAQANGYVCQCQNRSTFGKNCEYRLPVGITFVETMAWQAELLSSVKFSYIVYYETLSCDSGGLWLDWREICDGVQQCMYGYDEQNCDILEMNVCGEDEYRCLNGMCIPDEYFLDGDFDCLDWSDEMEYKRSNLCPTEIVSTECDDHICPFNLWSCGDGQCIHHRSEYLVSTRTDGESCRNQRNYHHMCELYQSSMQWTRPDGRCFIADTKIKNWYVLNDTAEDHCQYMMRCALSQGAHIHCPCWQNQKCFDQLAQICSMPMIPYPPRPSIAAFIHFLYDRSKQPTENLPSLLAINGTIKCRHSLVQVNRMVSFHFYRNISHLINDLCLNHINPSDSVVRCHHNNESTDVCQSWNPCMSMTRLNDGRIDCLGTQDERPRSTSDIDWSCSGVRRHRFRCSAEQPTCLHLKALGEGNHYCKNSYDEFWYGGFEEIAQMKCNANTKDDCRRLRQYIEQSWMTNNNNGMVARRRIPFRFYCNTFWDLEVGADENITECHEWWACDFDQEICDTGQCLDFGWESDLVRDCADGSDLKVPLFPLIQNALRFIQPAGVSENQSYLLRSSCHSESVFLCLSPHSSSTQFICLNQSQMGDLIADCAGAIDEANTWPHCSSPSSMLGNHFRCLSSNTCISYFHHCQVDHRCPNRSDDDSWCSILSNPVQCDNGFLRCDENFDCRLGEDEYMCDFETSSSSNILPYRISKQKRARKKSTSFQLPRFPARFNVSMSTTKPSENSAKQNSTNSKVPSSLAYHCQRGIMMWSISSSMLCFCPPQYYGDQCQYHANRLSILLHVDLSQSIHRNEADPTRVLYFLVLVLFESRILMKHEFYLRPALERDTVKKRLIYFLYPHSNQSLEERRTRYTNRSSILQSQPYSIRIIAYENRDWTKLSRIAVWHYPIFFDYLPVYRFAKILHLLELGQDQNPCANVRCQANQQCQPLMSKPTEYICLDPIQLSQTPCPVHHYGDRCILEYDPCASNPCLNGGSCQSTERLDEVFCSCRKEYYGTKCQLMKSFIRVSLQTIDPHAASVVQYFDIDSFSLDLRLVHQQVYTSLPRLIEHYRETRIATVIVLTKLYSSPSDVQPNFYLLLLHHNVLSVQGQTNISSDNECLHMHQLSPSHFPPFSADPRHKNRPLSVLDLSPIGYHHLCQRNLSLVCFRDDVYLCVCVSRHKRAECFLYDSELEQCAFCLAGGRCFRGDHHKVDDFLCLCPPCYTGQQCQFSTKSFTFTLDHLFYADLSSPLLLAFASLTFLSGLINNLCSFLTFRRRACLKQGVGYYLFSLSIINQINLTLFLARLIHITTNTRLSWNDLLCKLLHYLLLSTSRIVIWLSSLVAIERVYTTVFIGGRWLKKPRIARRLMLLSILGILSATVYEFVFYRSLFIVDDHQRSMCVFEFPIDYRPAWTILHLLLSIVSVVFPVFINLCSTLIISVVVVKNKVNTLKDKRQNYAGHRLRFIADVLRQHKELVIGPGITLIPQLFSLPYFFSSLILDCQNIENSWVRYLLIVSYWTSFIPQMIGFFMYISPSSLYSDEWRKTTIGRWLHVRFWCFPNILRGWSRSALMNVVW